MSNDNLREKMRQWVRGQSYCEENFAVMASLRPEARPESAITDVVLTSAELPAESPISERPRSLAFLE
jgi:hypothetical protein